MGDLVLKEFSKTLIETVRGEEECEGAVFRWGGEEFVVIAAAKEEEKLKALAEKLRKNVEAKRFPKVGKKTVSVGFIVVGPKGKRKLEKEFSTYFKKADKALYRAKEKGRNRVEEAK